MGMKKLGIICLTLCLQFGYMHSVEVQTENGKVLGKTVNTEFGEANLWSSIPYAKPPVGTLRFKHPIKPEPWNDVYDAREDPYRCWINIRAPGMISFNLQKYIEDSEFNEDCLYLTVAAPAVIPDTEKLPVMVYLYSSIDIIALDIFSRLPAFGNIILVAIQFRRGPFGFMYGKDEIIPGNAGFYDQIMGLEWVAKNIGNFGGDASKVTLAGQGQGSGASMVGLHLLSPLSKDMYTQAILQSGSPNFRYGIHDPDIGHYLFSTFANKLNCNDSATLTACINKLPAEEINKHTEIGYFQPVVDQKAILSTRGKLLTNYNGVNKTLLIGYNADEGWSTTFFFAPGYGSKDFIFTEEKLKAMVDKALGYLHEQFRELVFYNYNNWDNVTDYETMEKRALQFAADHITVCDIDNFVKFANKNDWSVYRYIFDYSLSSRPEDPYAYDGVEREFIWGIPFTDYENFNEEDKFMSRMMMRYVSNFVKSGNPNSVQDDKITLPNWEKYDSKEGYMSFTGFSSNFRDNFPHSKDCILWKLIDETLADYAKFNLGC